MTLRLGCRGFHLLEFVHALGYGGAIIISVPSPSSCPASTRMQLRTGLGSEGRRPPMEPGPVAWPARSPRRSVAARNTGPIRGLPRAGVEAVRGDGPLDVCIRVCSCGSWGFLGDQWRTGHSGFHRRDCSLRLATDGQGHTWGGEVEVVTFVQYEPAAFLRGECQDLLEVEGDAGMDTHGDHRGGLSSGYRGYHSHRGRPDSRSVRTCSGVSASRSSWPRCTP